jgi:hypothetical protein
MKIGYHKMISHYFGYVLEESYHDPPRSGVSFLRIPSPSGRVRVGFSWVFIIYFILYEVLLIFAP